MAKLVSNNNIKLSVSPGDQDYSMTAKYAPEGMKLVCINESAELASTLLNWQNNKLHNAASKHLKERIYRANIRELYFCTKHHVEI